jgi:hypothetical protein
MRRGKFILLTTAGAIATLAPFCRSRRSDKSLSQPLFLSTITDIKTLNQIGNAYRKQTTAEADEFTLTQLLTTTGNTAAPLNNKVKEDFATGQTLTINGWILSITEARQCALLSTQKP